MATLRTGDTRGPRPDGAATPAAMLRDRLGTRVGDPAIPGAPSHRGKYRRHTFTAGAVNFGRSCTYHYSAVREESPIAT